MKKRCSLKLTIASLLGLLLMVTPIVATAANIVTIQPQIELHKDNQLVSTNPFRFDLFYVPNDSASAEMIYSYLPEAPDANTIPDLQPGRYFIRLYDRDGQLQNDGQALIGIDFKLKLADTEVSLSQDDGSRLGEPVGELQTLGDGTVVYDIPFEITQSDYDQALATETGVIDVELDMVDPHTFATLQSGQSQNEENVETEENAQEDVQTDENQGEQVVETPTASEEITTTVQFVNEATGQPVEGIVVDFYGETHQSDANGAITFNQLDTTTYSFTIIDAPEAYSGYLQTEVPLDLTESANATVTYQLEAEEVKETYQHTVSVSDEETQVGVANVKVKIGDQEYVTDDSGQIYIYDIPEGTYPYEVVEVPEGYQLENQSITGEVTVPNEYATTWISLTPVQPQTGSFTLQASDEEGNPITGLTVMIGENQISTNENGQARFDALPTGTTTYTIQPRDGYTLVSPEQTGTLEISVEGTLLSVVLRAEVRTGQLVFTVLDETGTPVEGVNILLNQQQATTDQAGQVIFNEIDAGYHTYTVDEHLPKGYVAGDDMSGEIEVLANETAEKNIQIATQPVVTTADFQVVDQDGNPVPDTTLQINQEQFVTNGEGRVQVEYTEGDTITYQIIAAPAGYDLSQSQETKEITNPEETIQIVVQRLPEIRQGVLQIKDNSGHGIPGVEVEINQQVLTTNQEGKVQFDYQPGSAVSYAIKSVPDNIDLTEETTSGTIENPADGQVIQLASKPVTHQVTFKVTDEESQPLAGVGIQFNDHEAETNELGQVQFTDVPTGDYTYTVSKVPEGYLLDENTGSVAVKDNKEINQTIVVKKNRPPAQATIKVIDQHDQPVANANVAFGGLSGETNQDGVIKFEGLESGFYNIKIEGLPNGYINTYEGQKADIKSGDEYTNTLKVEKQDQKGRFVIQALDENSKQGVAGVNLIIGDKTYTTNASGYVETDDLSLGHYDFKINQLPKGYELIDGNTGQKTLQETGKTDWKIRLKPVAASETVSQRVNVASENRRESQEVTQLMKDEATGIEVWLTKEDANKGTQLNVEKRDKLAIPALENKDYDAYTIQVLNNQGQSVSLTHIAEVKIPVKTVQSKLNVIKPSGNTYQILNYQLNQQKVNIRTQNLGEFAVVYGDLANVNSNQVNEQSQSVTVSRTESVEEKKDLPKTGEQSGIVLVIGAVALLAVAGYLIFADKKRHSK